MVAVISSEKITTNGNLTIPSNCNMVIALVSGATNPTINLVAMDQRITKHGVSPAGDISISKTANPPTGTIACTVGQETRFVYLSDAGNETDVDGSTDGSAVTLTSTATDLILGVQIYSTDFGWGGTMTVDGLSVIFLDNQYTGYKYAPDTSVVCDGDSALAFISIATKTKFKQNSHWW